ncbi:helix-turn-helix domain-containing protein [Halorubrum kocurii]|uniref:Transcriptional regulator n=1 Tax=Halorubrum kocurii JCM 14978 TaxID=1230456 RepID=M0NNV9_9EURY|nr:helix-turn-helix domain-containing protein [Halorubrum kocurii]EMA59456.1 transcriptional regulator [Halorubrum kocurii JCM 14978]
MYDFTFEITYDAGADEYVDLFIDRESLRSEALFSCFDPTELWALESVTGDPTDLAAVDELLLDEAVDRESISARACNSTRTASLLTEEQRRRVAYTYISDVDFCESVPLIAAKYVDGGMLLEQTRTDDRVRWRVLVQDDSKIGHLYDTLSAKLGEGLSFSFKHLTEVDHWESGLLSRADIRAEQRETLNVAVERGYFETPREVTLDELADELELPRSTVSYRLRRATAELATRFAEQQL